MTSANAHIQGQAVSGFVSQGVLSLGQEVEIRPGLTFVDDRGRTGFKPITTRIQTILAGNRTLDFALPGEMIFVKTQLDPTLEGRDTLAGQMLGTSLPAVHNGKNHLDP